MNTAVLLLSACTVGADPAVVQASGFAKGGDCCGKAVVVNDCAPKCGCGLFSKLKNLCSSPCAKPACDACPKPAPVCTPCPKPAPVCNKCEKTHAPCDTCAPKRKCGLFGCLNFHINLCHTCDKGHKSCDKGCGTTVVAPATPVAPPANTPAPKPEVKPETKPIPPRVGSNYNPSARPETVPVITQSNGKIIIDVVPQN